MELSGEDRASRLRVEKLVGQLVELSRDEAACRVLGVDGSVEQQIDITFLEDPIDFVAYDLAVALNAGDENTDFVGEVPPLLATLVAEVKLCSSLAGRVDETELVRRTLEYLTR